MRACVYVVCVYEREWSLDQIGMYIAVKYLSIQMGLFCVQVVQWLWYKWRLLSWMKTGLCYVSHLSVIGCVQMASLCALLLLLVCKLLILLRALLI